MPKLLLSDHHLLLIVVWLLVELLWRHFCKVLGLVDLRLPAFWNLNLLLHGELRRRRHDLDGERDNLALTNLIPCAVLDEKLEHVVDIDATAVERGGKCGQQRSEACLNSVIVTFLVLLLHWDLNREEAVRRLPCFDSVELVIDNIDDLLTLVTYELALKIVTPLSAFITTHKLELEVFDIFIALGIVSDDTNSHLFTEIVLVLVEEDLGDGRGPLAETQTTANLTFQVELEVELWGLDGRPVDIDHLAAIERGDTMLSIRPILIMHGCKLGVQGVLDAHAILPLPSKHHASRQPVRNRQ